MNKKWIHILMSIAIMAGILIGGLYYILGYINK